MTVEAITRETADTVSLTLKPRDGAAVSFEAGQFLTLEVPIEGVRHRRAYSIASPESERSCVTVVVKRVPGGLVSNHLHDRVKVGDVLDVHGPSGTFTVDDVERPRRIVLVAGGSGITPMMAILRTHLERSPALRFTLVYGSRSLDRVIFREALDGLAVRHADRFSVHYALEEAPEGWAGVKGRLDEGTCARVFESLSLDGREDWMLCGPDPMMAAVRAVLRARKVPVERVREERFFTPVAARTVATWVSRMATVRTPSGERTFTVPVGTTLLDAGLAAGVDMPFSCTMGGCGACRVKVHQGEFVLDEPNCLTPAERTQGYALACSARPVTDVVLEVAP